MLGIFMSTAYAQAATGTAAAPKPSMLETLAPFILIFVVMYFFMGRSQQKRVKEQQQFLNSLKRGDRVITSGGIYGEITNISEKVITMQVADNVRIKVARSQIAGLAKEGNA